MVLQVLDVLQSRKRRKTKKKKTEIKSEIDQNPRRFSQAGKSTVMISATIEAYGHVFMQLRAETARDVDDSAMCVPLSPRNRTAVQSAKHTEHTKHTVQSAADLRGEGSAATRLGPCAAPSCWATSSCCCSDMTTPS